MNNISLNKPWRLGRLMLALSFVLSATDADAQPFKDHTSMHAEHTLPASRLAIGPIAAFAATGDIPQLKVALARGLDAGLSISECKEVLVQLYAYAGFPRSLNALTAITWIGRVGNWRPLPCWQHSAAWRRSCSRMCGLV